MDRPRAIVAARLSRKQANGDDGIGIETQDERSREYVDQENIELVAVVADTKSGTVAPWDRKNLKPWVTDPAKMALYDAIVAYKTDRLSRGTQEDFTRIEHWATEHGKRLIIVNGPQYPARDDSDYWQWTAEKRQARKELEAIQERTGRAIGQIKASGYMTGRPPFGYAADGVKYRKTMVPTDAGRIYVPEIFQRVSDGIPLVKIAAWLDSEHVKPNSQNGVRWSPKSLSQMIRCRTYVGERKDAAGLTVLDVEPLVDAKLWLAANKRLDNAPVGRRNPSNGEPALLTGALRCGRCDSPMYRIRSRGRQVYYRCHGQGPQPKGCGVMVAIPLLDAIVDDMMTDDGSWVMESTFVPGSNYDAEIAEIQLAIRDLGTRNLSDDEYDAELVRLRAERDRLRELPATPDRWDVIPVIKDDGTPLTEAERWRDADNAGKRQILKDHRIHFSWTDDQEPRVIMAPLWASETDATSPS